MSKCKTKTKPVIFRLYYKVIIKPNNLQRSCYLYTTTGRDDIIFFSTHDVISSRRSSTVSNKKLATSAVIHQNEKDFSRVFVVQIQTIQILFRIGEQSEDFLYQIGYLIANSYFETD